MSYTFILPNCMFKNPEAAKCSVEKTKWSVEKENKRVHYTIALTDVEEHCSALHVGDRLRGFSGSLCALCCSLSTVCRLYLSGWTMKLQFHHTDSHTHTKHKVALVNEL